MITRNNMITSNNTYSDNVQPENSHRKEQQEKARCGGRNVQMGEQGRNRLYEMCRIVATTILRNFKATKITNLPRLAAKKEYG